MTPKGHFEIIWPLSDFKWKFKMGQIFVAFWEYLNNMHSWFLEHWNSQKSLCNIWHRFSYLLDELIEKICKKKFFHGGFFFKSTLSVLRCTWTGLINLKIFLGHHINHLSIWPFMCHPWFPTKKAVSYTHLTLPTILRV